MDAPKARLPKRISEWLNQWLLTQKMPPPLEILPLAGDGSTRSFFRLKWKSTTQVLLADPDWIFSKDYPAHQQYLASCGIPVPAFLGCSPEVGALVMEDLGDELLQFELKKHPQKKMAWLERAIRMLAKLHGATFPVAEELPAASRHFDRAKYLEELRYTQEHLSEKLFREKPLPPEASKTLEFFCASIGNLPPEVFCHRDFHTRNILVHKDELALIDFQDARLGAPHYDVASLLYDAYVPLSVTERAALLESYRKELSQFHHLYEKISWGAFESTLARVAFQRVVKAAGSFASFFTRHGKTTHLPYLVPALESALSLWKANDSLRKDLDGVYRLEAWIARAQEKPWQK